MTPVDDIGVAIAHVYAQSLLNVAKDAGAVDETIEELRAFVNYVNTHPAFESFLTGIGVDRDARRGSLEKTLRGRMSDLLVDLVQVLNRKDRLELLEAVADRCRLLHEQMNNRIEVTATTATPLMGPTRQALLDALRKHTGKEPILTERTDSSLIGGLVLHAGDERIDFSVQRKIAGLRSTLFARASREIHSGRTYFEES